MKVSFQIIPKQNLFFALHSFSFHFPVQNKNSAFSLFFFLGQKSTGNNDKSSEAREVGFPQK